jgi:hypothetical protein
MAMKKGEKYECTNPECGCTVSVTRGSEALNATRAPRCCCGEEMMAKEATASSRSSGGRGTQGFET